MTKKLKEEDDDQVYLDWKTYANFLDLPEQRIGNYSIEHRKQFPGYTAQLFNGRTMMFGGHSLKEIKFPVETTWHVLKENESIWTSDLPIEHYQQGRVVREFHGDVLVGGLGVGLVTKILAYMPQVQRIDVVEISKEVTQLVLPYLLKDPVIKKKFGAVYNQDLHEFLKKLDRPYHHGFYDIWQSDGEGTFFEHVVPLRDLSYGKVRNVVCWNEDVMRGQLILGLNTRIAMLTNPAWEEHRKKSNISLEKFCDGIDEKEPASIFLNWSKFFFQWIRNNDLLEQPLNLSILQLGLTQYVGLYGTRPDWLQIWKDRVEAMTGYSFDRFKTREEHGYATRINRRA